jgi:hypothetical protein
MSSLPIPDVVLYVSLSELKNTFQFCTDSAKNVDLSDNFMRYYVFPDNWIQLTDQSMNILNSQVVTNAVATATSTNQLYAPNKMLIKYDFMRYISKSLFSTPYGAGLFKNETELIEDLNRIGGISSGILRDISNSLWKCGANSNGDISYLQDVSGVYYSNNSNTSIDNICRVLVKTIYENDPSRFISTANEVTAENQQYYRQSIPFIDGDVINFTIILHPEINQHNLTGVQPIAVKSYNVSLIVSENPYPLNPVPTN